MSRKAGSLLLAGLSVVLGLGLLAGWSLASSLMADARTEKLAGPGVDVFLRTPFVAPSENVVLEVIARGGSHAGMEYVTVWGAGTVLAQAAGGGVTWGSVIRSGKGRGSESVHVSFEVPAGVPPHSELSLLLEVEYVCAMSSGAGEFANERFSGRVPLKVAHIPAEDRLAVGAGMMLPALIGLLVWCGIFVGVARWVIRPEADAVPGEDEETLGVGLLLGFMAGGFVGYWLFARSVMAIAGSQSSWAAFGLTSLWLALPIGLTWWLHRRARARAE